MIQEALDKRVHTFGILIDLTKAYNVLNHELLRKNYPPMV